MPNAMTPKMRLRWIRATRLTAGRDRLRELSAGLAVRSEPEIEFLPNRNQGVSQLLDQPKVVRRGGGNPQSLGASCNRRIIDRLDVDRVPLEEKIARLFA
jgi:hypothetical protein